MFIYQRVPINQGTSSSCHSQRLCLGGAPNRGSVYVDRTDRWPSDVVDIETEWDTLW